MTKEQKDKILILLAEKRNNYAKECQERIQREFGKIESADYMLQIFYGILNKEDYSQKEADAEE